MNFSLRPFTLQDVDSLVKYGNNFEIAKFMMNQYPFPFTEERAKFFIEFAMKGSPTHIFAIDVDGEAVGRISLHHKEDIECKNMELAYWLGEPFWNNGIITKAIQQIVDYGFKTFDITRIFARPFGSNIASQKALEKAGFQLEARFEKTFFKNERYEDELVYAVRK